MTTFVDLAVRILPDLARLVAGDPGGRVAAAAAEAVRAAAAGAAPAEAERALDADPARRADLRLRLAEIAARAEADRRAADLAEMTALLRDDQARRDGALADLSRRLDDVGDARRMTARLAATGGPAGYGPLVVTCVVLFAFVFLLGFMVGAPGNVAEMAREQTAFQLFNITFGALTAAFATVVSFWLGSSQGSRLKDEAAVRREQGETVASKEALATVAAVATARAETPPDSPANLNAPPARLEAPRFDACVAHILEKEGGFVDHPSDPGGATNLGITIATLAAWRRKPVTVADVRALAPAEARDIYFFNYWSALRCEKLPQGVDLVVFDFGVNAGPGTAARALQRAVFVAEDGVIGPITLGAVEKFAADDLIRRFGQARMRHYEALDKPEFIKGWRNRTEDIERVALSMARGGLRAA